MKPNDPPISRTPWSRLQDSWAFGALCRGSTRLRRQRRFHAYCVGTAKSGTTSLARILTPTYRSAHEPGTVRLIPRILAHRNGHESRAALLRFLRARDAYHWLEFESNHFLFPVLPELLELFPDARFVLTIRDCFSWLNSEINQQLLAEDRPPWKEMQDLRYKKSEARYDERERSLRDMGLFPLSHYFSYWTEHNRTVIERVPPNRLLTIRTSVIGRSLAEIAHFLGIPEGTLAPSRSHEHERLHKDVHIAELVDPGFIDEQAEIHCRGLMDEFFPEIESVRQAVLGRRPPG